MSEVTTNQDPTPMALDVFCACSGIKPELLTPFWRYVRDREPEDTVKSFSSWKQTFDTFMTLPIR